MNFILYDGTGEEVIPFLFFYTLCLRYVCYLIIFVFLCGKIQTRESHYRSRKHIIDELVEYLGSNLRNFVFLDETVSLPIKVQYKTPKTLGKDRLAAAVGANYLQPEKDLLVIDAGTAITYELIDASGSYLGGNISPGMTTRFRALNLFTEKLPLVVEQEYIPLVGTDTETAIQAGVVNGIVCEMDGYIEMLRLKYPNLLVFLTGGHSFYFERRLKNSIFADINLVLTGLNRILEYNVED